jgi:tetratricopeptide (TPR) repeat protein
LLAEATPESLHELPELAGGDPGLTAAFAIAATGDGRDAVGRPGFLDVETTGLDRSAATLVIVVGLGYFRDGQLVTRQFFLDDPAAEPTMLGEAAELIGGFDGLITFNGKSFDVPLLAGRYAMHRRKDPVPAVHLDLLHPARRIWRRRLGQTSLGALEARLLGSVRESDVPGYEIPARYYAYLRDGRRGAIEPVLEHNRRDLVALARLALRLDSLLRDPSLTTGLAPGDWLGLAGLLEARGQLEAARRCYESCLAGASSVDRAEAAFRLAGLTRARGELAEAIQLYEAVAGFLSPRAAAAALELAKLYERQLRDSVRALACARRAVALLERSPGASRPALLNARARLARLEARHATDIAASSARPP